MSDGVAMQPGALQHVKVLDLSRVLAGPWAAQTLGDLGAEVIKVERPGSGDDARAWGPPYVTDAAGQPTGESADYMCTNRNKQSVSIDFTQPEGQDLVRRLAQQCDVLVENFKTGGLAQYGLDYASLSALNPRLVYCSVTGFGQSGPYAHRAGYDFLIQGMVPCGPINTVQSVFDDPQVRARGMQIAMRHPQAGDVPLVASPIRLSDTPVRYRHAPPQLGQHTDAVLQERLGLSPQAIGALREQGVVA